METKVLNYRVVIEQDEDGVFVASIPSLSGCYTEGNTFEEVLENIKDALKTHLAVRKDISLLSDDSKTEFVGVKNLKIPYGFPAYC